MATAFKVPQLSDRLGIKTNLLDRWCREGTVETLPADRWEVRVLTDQQAFGVAICAALHRVGINGSKSLAKVFRAVTRMDWPRRVAEGYVLLVVNNASCLLVKRDAVLQAEPGARGFIVDLVEARRVWDEGGRPEAGVN